VQAYIGPPIAAVFLVGIMSKTVNSYGAIWGLIGGGLIGALRFVSELLHNFYNLKNTFFSWFVEINFLHFAVFLFLVSLSIVFIVSKLYGTKVVNGLPQYQTAGIPKLSKQAVSNLELKKQV
jgi:SSS family solute:Na+ symporter